MGPRLPRSRCHSALPTSRPTQTRPRRLAGSSIRRTGAADRLLGAPCQRSVHQGQRTRRSRASRVYVSIIVRGLTLKILSQRRATCSDGR